MSGYALSMCDRSTGCVRFILIRCPALRRSRESLDLFRGSQAKVNVMFDRHKGNKPVSPVGQKTGEIKQDDLATNMPASTAARAKAMIGKSIKIKGEITGDENLIIEGSVEGSINLDAHEIIIGLSGNVCADVNAKVIKIEGKIEGDIVGNEKVVIAKSGDVRGNIIAPRVTLEDGARFKGSIDMDPEDKSSAGLTLSTPKIANKPPRVDASNREPTVVVKNG